MTIGMVVKERILELCKEREITVNKLSTICGLTQSTLNNIVNGERPNPTIGTIKKVCDGLEISILDFFDTELFAALEQEVR